MIEKLGCSQTPHSRVGMGRDNGIGAVLYFAVVAACCDDHTEPWTITADKTAAPLPPQRTSEHHHHQPCSVQTLTLITRKKENERVSCTHSSTTRGRKGSPNAPAQQSHAHAVPQHSCLWSACKMTRSSTQFPCMQGKDFLPQKVTEVGRAHSCLTPSPIHVPILSAGTWAQEKGRWQSLDTPSPSCAREPAHTDFHENSVEYCPTKGA